MRRATILLPLLAIGAGATAALAQDEPTSGNTEPQVRSRQVFSLPGGCRPGEKVTIGVKPSGTLLTSVRVHVAGLEVIRLTGVQGPASATVRIPSDATRVTATGDTLGGQELYLSRIYGRCPAPAPSERPVVGGGED